MWKRRHNKLKDSVTFLCLLVAVWLLGIEPVYAYIDPGTGSYLFQLLIAGLLGGTIALKLYWKQIIGFIRNRRGGGDGDNDDENGQDSS